MKTLLIFFCVLWTLPTLAVEAFRGPLSSSLGGTGLAGLAGIEGTLLNPAQVSLLKGYAIDGYYRDGYLAEGEHRQGWGIGAGDNGGDVMFPGVFHYARVRDTGRGPKPVSGELIHMAISEPVVTNLFFGVSGYQLRYSMIGFPQSTQWNFSTGLLWLATPEFGVAYVLNNIAHPSSKVPLGLREELQQGIGLYGVIAEIAGVRFDLTRHEVNNPRKRLVYMTSFESMSGKFAIVRAGFRRDEQRDERYMTLGIGFNGPRVKFDYAFEKNLEGTAGALHSVDLRLPF